MKVSFTSVNFIDLHVMQNTPCYTPQLLPYFVAETQKPCFLRKKIQKMLINRLYILPKERYKMLLKKTH